MRETETEIERQNDRQNQQSNQSRERAGDETKACETATVGHKIKKSMGGKSKRWPTEQQGRARGEDRVRQLILRHGCAN